jgi:hypothetical protein
VFLFFYGLSLCGCFGWRRILCGHPVALCLGWLSGR